ncbi:MAG: tRNA (adenosine(37)-N6)-threonylcarbamoyltransferase complex transferase subunit TsaD [Candidatus Moranbacteria bacterium]|nr:tRNA (adenosine(37)-N6)-threonylcarbamoyltransferase complex transferase subunit TsaD [Candidatus Moranbacteria bacterium]
MKLLSIETTCDETSFALGAIKANEFSLLKSKVLSQTAIHQKYGGVVPNLSAREHLNNFIPVLDGLLKEAKTGLRDIDAFVVANGPGLIPALLIGVSIAKSLAYFYQKSLIPIHHLEGHIYANWLNKNGKLRKAIQFPVLALIVSGGHTQLVYLKNHLNYEIIGETLDDAAGEAFDKVAKMLELGYPGGPKVSQMAAKGKVGFYQFPVPMRRTPDLNFSFSGLKTSVLTALKKYKKPYPLKVKQDIAASFQEAVILSLIHKTEKAIKKYKPQSLLLAGGVSANSALRRRFEKTAAKYRVQAFIPLLQYCGDNAAMHLVAAYFKLRQNGLKKYQNNWKKVQADAELAINSLP